MPNCETTRIKAVRIPAKLKTGNQTCDLLNIRSNSTTTIKVAVRTISG